MKKRIVALITAFCLVTPSLTVSAETVSVEDVLKEIPEIEDFSLHSGTMFGDSLEDIKTKEEEAGFLPSRESSESGLTYVFFSHEQFAGINDTVLRYIVDYHDGLLFSGYLFSLEQQNDEEKQNDDFDRITSELIKKYGDPVFYDEDGIPFMLLKYRGKNAATGFGDLASGNTNDISHYNQWLIKADDYYVLIDHNVNADWSEQYFEWDYKHELTYFWLDEQTVVDTFEEYINLENETDGPINSDDL